MKFDFNKVHYKLHGYSLFELNNIITKLKETHILTCLFSHIFIDSWQFSKNIGYIANFFPLTDYHRTNISPSNFLEFYSDLFILYEKTIHLDILKTKIKDLKQSHFDNLKLNNNNHFKDPSNMHKRYAPKDNSLPKVNVSELLNNYLQEKNKNAGNTFNYNFLSHKRKDIAVGSLDQQQNKKYKSNFAPEENKLNSSEKVIDNSSILILTNLSLSLFNTKNENENKPDQPQENNTFCNGIEDQLFNALHASHLKKDSLQDKNAILNCSLNWDDILYEENIEKNQIQLDFLPLKL